MKTKKMTLEYNPTFVPSGFPYKVVRVEHTTDYNPGDALPKDVVDALNHNDRWHVVVVAAK